MEKGITIYIEDEDKTDEILKFEEGSDYCFVTFRNKPHKPYKFSANKIQVVRASTEDSRHDSPLDYFKDIAVIKDRELDKKAQHIGQTINTLQKQYHYLPKPKRGGLLDAFLQGKLPANQAKTGSKSQQPIYPFGFNTSQKTAVDNALNNRVSIVEGPPGTGKTQTILNLIANIVYRGQTVAVVSSNNSAIDNVRTKLEATGLGYISAFLGNSENKRVFFENQPPIPDDREAALSSEESAALQSKMKRDFATLHNILDTQIKHSKVKKELAGFRTEEEHFTKELAYKEKVRYDANLRAISSSDEALAYWVAFEHFTPPGSLKKTYLNIMRFFSKDAEHQHNVNLLAEQHKLSDLILECQKKFYQLKIFELETESSKLARDLRDVSFDVMMREYSQSSMAAFKDYLAQLYDEERPTDLSQNILWDHPEDFLNLYPVVLSTTHSLRNCLPKATYDYVIVDESSQVDLCTGLLAFASAENAVIVGDLKQLSHVVSDEIAQETNSLFANYDLRDIYRYSDNSLLSTAVSLFPDVPRVLLREHYRCHPKIIDFCNRKFYNDQLIVLTEDRDELNPIVVCRTLAGNHARGHVNRRQIDMIKEEIYPKYGLENSDLSVGIITPYNKQAREAERHISGANVKSSTVHSFQGQEQDVIILSTVDNVISDFTDNPNLLNVAVSRAVKQLIVVVNGGDDMIDKNVGDLVRYIEYHKGEIVKSKISSVFDLLFESYAAKRLEYLKDSRRISEFDSENIMYKVISDALAKRQDTTLGVACHVPLNRLIRDVKLLDGAEQHFVFGTDSHVDFMIYDTLGKTAKFAIEVDGAAFHSEGDEQVDLDRRKDGIFEKYGIPLYRFRTDESGEAKRLTAILNTHC